MLKRWKLSLLASVLLLLATYPIFFDAYRTAAFKAVPYDDYAPYLLAVLGKGGELPGAPFVYRVFSVAVASPFYYLLPVYSFTNLHGVDLQYLRATQAITFVSYLALLLNAVVIYILARMNHAASRASALIVAMLSIFCFGSFISKIGVDSLAILMVSLLLLVSPRKSLFIPLMLLSIGVNEKIPLLFLSVFCARYLWLATHRKPFQHWGQLTVSMFAVVIYFFAVWYFKFPGNEAQTNPGAFGKAVASSLSVSFSLKGLVLNVLPMTLLSIFVWMAARERVFNNFELIDISGVLVLMGLAVLAGVVFNIGRVVMYSYPLYLPAAAYFIDRVLGVSQVGGDNSVLGGR